MEVYANERFASGTMVYTGSGGDGSGEEGASGLSCFAEGGVECAVFESVEVWKWDGEGRGSVVVE